MRTLSLAKLLSSVARYFGYRLLPIEHDAPLDLRTSNNHPSSLLYHSFARPILVDLDFNLGRGLRIFPFSKERHPFVHALKKALKADDRKHTIYRELKGYYDAVQPRSAACWLNLAPSDSTVLFQAKPWALSMPWDQRSLDDWQTAREQFAIEENLHLGHNISIENGWHFWGPVHPIKLQVETDRLSTLLSSIETKGLTRHDYHDGDIRAVVLRKRDGSWRWQVAGGEHRAAVMAALGHSSVPARVLQVINRDDAAIWPGVVAGTFSHEAALKAFDLIFDGSLPNVVRPWAEQINSTHFEPCAEV